MLLKMGRKWEYPQRFCRLYHEHTPKIFVWDVYSKYKPHGFQVFRALFEKAVRRLAFPARPEAQYPDLVNGGHGLQTPNKSKISEKMDWCGRQNMLWPHLKIWDWDWILGRAVKAISSLGVRSPWLRPFLLVHLSSFKKIILHFSLLDFVLDAISHRSSSRNWFDRRYLEL